MEGMSQVLVEHREDPGDEVCSLISADLSAGSGDEFAFSREREGNHRDISLSLIFVFQSVYYVY